MIESFFTFDGYTLRPIRETDRNHLVYCIEQDEYHQNKMTADFFYKLQPGEEAYALEDESGKVVFYLKNSVAVRMDIQFTPITSIRNVRDNQSALMRGLQWIEGLFRAKRYREIIFEADGPELYVFAKRRLGFRDATVLSRQLMAPPKNQETQHEAVGTLATSKLEGR